MPTYNKELVEKVSKGESSIMFIKSKDNEQELQELISHIFPDDKEPVSDFIHTNDKDVVFLSRDSSFDKLWTFEYATSKPSLPVSSFLVTCEEEKEVVNWETKPDGELTSFGLCIKNARKKFPVIPYHEFSQDYLKNKKNADNYELRSAHDMHRISQEEKQSNFIDGFRCCHEETQSPSKEGEEWIMELNENQKSGNTHPYTCCGGNGNSDCKRKAAYNKRFDGENIPFTDENEGVLLATEYGWICPCGKYTQPLPPKQK